MIIIGLGNPGKKYEKTRHNAGFRIIEEFAKENNFPDFKFIKKFNSLISEGFLNEKKIILAQPQTFMNNSGIAVKKIIENCKLKIENLIVIHDDIDLPLGKIKIVKNRGSAGHKGVESIIKLQSKNFIRIRVGIKPDKENKMENQERFVIQEFDKEEENLFRKNKKKIIKAIESIITDGLEKTMNKFNNE